MFKNRKKSIKERDKKLEFRLEINELKKNTYTVAFRSIKHFFSLTTRYAEDIGGKIHSVHSKFVKPFIRVL